MIHHMLDNGRGGVKMLYSLLVLIKAGECTSACLTNVFIWTEGTLLRIYHIFIIKGGEGLV